MDIDPSFSGSCAAPGPALPNSGPQRGAGFWKIDCKPRDRFTHRSSHFGAQGVPREVRDLIAAARNAWLVCFDNLSHLPEDLADAACRLATGGGFCGRQLSSDHNEAIFDATRPLIFNAIPELGTARPEFLDRALIVEFLALPSELRRDEARYWSEFSERQPRILGALLDAAVEGLRNLPRVRLERPPRLADFALWVSACEEALGMKPGEAITACRANSAEAHDLVLEASPLYQPLVEL